MALVEAQLSDKVQIFLDIKNQYPSKHEWTVDDLEYTTPPENWLAQTRPLRPRAGAPTPAHYEVEVSPPNQRTGRSTVTIIGINLKTQKKLRYTAGSILYH
jgi:hypothetical protein